MAPRNLITSAFEYDTAGDEFMTIDASLAKLKLSYEQNAQPIRKRVCFNLGRTKLINPQVEFYTDDDVNDKWMNGEALANIKLDAKRISAVLRRISKQRGTCIVSHAHRKTTLMMKSDFRALGKLTPTAPDQDLAQWCMQMDGRRGLERFASSDFNVIRCSDVIATRKAVFDEQDRQRDFCVRPDPETLAKLACECSRRARTFARFMGVADSIAIGEELDALHKRRVTPARAQSEFTMSPFGNGVTMTPYHIQPTNQHGDMEVQRQAPPRKKSKLQLL
jgi:hypothetical protein